jgi:hypothetical protein
MYSSNAITVLPGICNWMVYFGLSSLCASNGHLAFRTNIFSLISQSMKYIEFQYGSYNLLPSPRDVITSLGDGRRLWLHYWCINVPILCATCSVPSFACIVQSLKAIPFNIANKSWPSCDLCREVTATVWLPQAAIENTNLFRSIFLRDQLRTV